MHLCIGTGPIWYSEMDCIGIESGLTNCRHEYGVIFDHTRDAGAICTGSKSGIRLVGGATPYEGRVEVMQGGKWRTVCDNGWGQKEGEVVCRQMGFAGLVRTAHRGEFVGGTGDIINR